MADTKNGEPKYPRKVSPAGRAKYPRLSGTPDTKFNAQGEWHVKLLLDPNDKNVKEYLAFLDEQTDAALAQMKDENPKYAKQMKAQACYHMELDDQGDETGLIEIGFKQQHKVVAKRGKNEGKTFEFKPALFDAKGAVLSESVKIGGGSIIKVSAEFRPYFNAKDKVAGITKKLLAVQVIDLQEYTSAQDASGFGFSEEEGYAADEHTEFAKTAANDSSESSTSDDDSNAGDF